MNVRPKGEQIRVKNYFFWAVLGIGIFFMEPEQTMAQMFSLRNYTVDDGLAQSVIYDVQQDPNGFVWFSTQDGISRFNGVKFENFSSEKGLITNLARVIAFDSEGALWVGTDLGLSIMRGNHFESLSEINGREINKIRTILKDRDGSMWIGTVGNGLFHFNGKQFIHFGTDEGLLDERVYAIAQDLDGQIWIGTNSALFTFDGEVFKEIDLKSLGYDPVIRSVAVDAQNRVWAGGYDWGLVEIDSGVITLHNSDWNFPEGRINDIYFDADQRMWAGLDGAGIFYKDGDDIQVYGKKQGFFNNSILSIFQDSQRNMWFGTYGGGVFQLSRSFIKTYNSLHGLTGENVTALVRQSNGTMWLGTNNNGLFRFQNGDFTNFSTKNSTLPSDRIHSLYVDVQDQLWIGIDGGFTRRLGNRFVSTNLEERFPGVSIRAFLEDTLRDQMLMGTFGDGVLRWKNRYLGRLTKKEGLVNDSVLTITQNPNGSIWFATDGGISIWDGQHIENHVNQGLPTANRTSTLLLSEQRQWVGTFGAGIWKIGEGDKDLFDESDGLTNNIVSFLIEDSYERVWVGTKRGLTILEADRVTRITTANGLLSDEINQRTGLLDPNNQLWFGTVKGLTRIDMNEIIAVNSSFPLYLSNIRVMEKDTITNAALDLAYSQNFITFEFIGLNYANPKSVNYRYRLVGLDDSWKYTQRTIAQYTSLPPGEYTFKVEAQNEIGQWSGKAESALISIYPPIYRQPWFIGLGWVALIGIALLWVRVREKQLVQYNQELETQVEKRAKELQQSQRLFKMITENAADLIMVFSPDGTVRYCSPSIKNLLGHDLNEFVEKHPFSYLKPLDRRILHESFDMLKTRRIPMKTTYQVQDSKGKWRYFEGTASVVDDSEGQESEVLIVTVSHDVTSTKHFEKELKKSKDVAEQANRAKSMFLASMSHELRTPLNSIIGFSQILERAPEIPEKLSKFITIMHRSGEHLLNMINDILDVSKIEAGQIELAPTEFRIRTLGNDLYNMFSIQADEKDIDFSVDVKDYVPATMYQDPNKVNQILINLVSNAIKFTEKGYVKVTVDFDEPQKMIRVRVEDSGRGIPKGQLKDIFSPFQQVVGQFSKGTGLGLTISKSLANLMKGDIFVSSHVGKGSTFTLTLPYQTTDLTSDSEVLVAEQKNIIGIDTDKPIKALIVDDIEDNRTLLTAFLEPLGVICQEAVDGRDAVLQSQNFNPNIIFMDIVMPDMDGREAMIKIKSNLETASVPIIAVTASGFYSEKAEMLEQGFDNYIRKPFKESEFFDVVSRHLNVGFIYEEDQKKKNKEPNTSFRYNSIVEHLRQLQGNVKEDLCSAIEFTDIDEILALCEQHLTGTEIGDMLIGKAKKNDFRFFITLNEVLNPN